MTRLTGPNRAGYRSQTGLAIELGPAGVRVVCLPAAANPDSRTIQATGELFVKATNGAVGSQQKTESLAQGTMLKRSSTTADTASALLLAPDLARMMTGAFQARLCSVAVMPFGAVEPDMITIAGQSAGAVAVLQASGFKSARVFGWL